MGQVIQACPGCGVKLIDLPPDVVCSQCDEAIEWYRAYKRGQLDAPSGPVY